MEFLKSKTGKAIIVIVVLVLAYFSFKPNGWLRSASTTTGTTSAT